MADEQATAESGFPIRAFQFLLILLVSVLVYSNSIRNEFIWDDVHLITKNLLIRDPGNLPRLFLSDYWDLGDGSPYDPGNYRPLTVASYLLNYQLTGPSPIGFRSVNVILHAFNSATVFTLGLLLGLTSGWALAAALLFALHPVHTEAVVWITGRAELLACGFFLISLCLFLLYQRSEKASHLIWSVVSFALALLSKESAITLVPIVAAAQFLGPGESPRPRPRTAVLQLAPYLGTALLYFALRLAVLGTFSQASEATFGFLFGRTITDVFLIMTKVFAYYWVLLILPLRLSAHYDSNDFPVPQSLLEPSFLFAVLAHLLVATAVVWTYKRGNKTLCFALSWVPITLLPYSHIVHFEWLLAERFLYIPSVGFVMALVLSADRLLSWRSRSTRQRAAVSAVLVATVMALYCTKTVTRNRVWRDHLTFFGVLAKEKPWVAGLRMAYGDVLLQEKRYDEAIFEYEEAMRLWPQMPGVRERLVSLRQLQSGSKGPTD